MSLLKKIEKMNKSNIKDRINEKKIKFFIEGSQKFNKRFDDRIGDFIEELKIAIKTKNIAEELIILDGKLFLKDLVEINYSFCFEDFNNKTLTALPLFFINFEKYKEKTALLAQIPNIYMFSEEISCFLKKYNLNSSDYVSFGEKDTISEDSKINRYITVEEMKVIIKDAEVLLNKYFPLFIEDLENFVINKSFNI